MEDKSYIKKLRKVLDGKLNYQKFRYITDLGHDFDFIKEVYPKDVKTFKDLKFGQHKSILTPSAVSSYLEFDNGHFVSVVGGAAGLYGDGKDTFELGYLNNDLTNMEVIGWLTPEEITKVMVTIQTKNLINKKDEYSTMPKSCRINGY